MAAKRQTGRFEWYNQTKGYGLILGDDGEEYFAHSSNLVDISQPRQGQIVTFYYRSRPLPKGGWEAHDIREQLPVKKPAQKAQQESKSEISSLAQEVLRLKRERRDGLIPTPVEDMPPGTRVYDPHYGNGTVVLTSKEILSVRLDDQPGRVVEIRRQSLMKAAPNSAPSLSRSLVPEPVKRPAIPPLINTLKKGATLSGYLAELTSEIKQALFAEGLEAGEIYRYDEPEEPTTPAEAIQIDARVAQAFLKSSKITHFYSHQAQARKALLKSKDIVISTPTASGKTEAYNPTILEHLLQNPSATALYLFPLVALGFDQTDRLQKLNQSLPLADQLQIGILNSNVSSVEKSETLRANNRILVTTPDSLHYIILPKKYPNWRNFFRNLRYIVVDEAHVYKGVFGANMANILRRLLVRCRRDGNPLFPQVIISSATIRHPDKLAHQLTGLSAKRFEVITESGAPKPGRHFLVTRSDIHDLETLCGDLFGVNIQTKEKQPRPVSLIVFLRSINEVKKSAQNLRDHLRRTGRSDQTHLVDEYYADKADKTDVLIRLRQGQIRCVFTTTALMAGIDIGSLDVAIVKNFPRLVMDARQMFGRAGRAGEGAVIFVADRTDPFDQFYFEKPELLFTGPTEDVVANPENPILLAAHLHCAAQTIGQYNQEGPLSGEFVGLFGQMGQDLLERMVARGNLSISLGSYRLNSVEDPHDMEPLDNIRSMSSETYVLKDAVSGQKLEDKRKDTAYRDAHRDAIVWVGGQPYKVIQFDEQSREIMCRPETSRSLRTKGIEEKQITILSEDSGVKDSDLQEGVLIKSGEIKLTTSVSSYVLYKTLVVMQCRNRACKHETPNLDVSRCPKCNSPVRAKNKEEVDDEYQIPVPPTLAHSLTTRSVWVDVPAKILQQFSQEFWPRWQANDSKGVDPEAIAPNFEYAFHSLEHALLKAFPEYIRCDPDEIASYYDMDENSRLAGRLFIYDNFPGGLGLTDEFRYEPKPILEGALEIIERCNCIDDEGCPVCLNYFGCHNFNQALSKLAGRYLLKLLLGQSTQQVLVDLKEYVARAARMQVIERPSN